MVSYNTILYIYIYIYIYICIHTCTHINRITSTRKETNISPQKNKHPTPCTHPVLQVDVGPPLQELVHHAAMTVLCGPVQRGHLVLQ